MTASVTVELPEEVLVEALRRLSPLRRHQLFLRTEGRPLPTVNAVPAADLDKWVGLVAAGGDALEDSEQVYDDPGCA